jgi:hypothetical protein
MTDRRRKRDDTMADRRKDSRYNGDRRKTDDTMADRRRTKRQTIVHKTLYRKRQIELHEPH